MRTRPRSLQLMVTALLALGCADQGPSETLAVARTPVASGNGQSTLVDGYVHDPIRVLVTEGGKPKEGVSVVWETSGQGANVGPPTVTGSDGIAQTFWKMAWDAGPHLATATVAGATGSPVTFEATGLADTPTRIEIESGDGQSQAAGSRFVNPLSVRVTDHFHNELSRVPVDWTVTAGSAVLESASTSTAPDGIARVGLTAGSSPGTATITATLGVNSSVAFNVTIVAP